MRLSQVGTTVYTEAAILAQYYLHTRSIETSFEHLSPTKFSFIFFSPHQGQRHHETHGLEAGETCRPLPIPSSGGDRRFGLVRPSSGGCGAFYLFPALPLSLGRGERTEVRRSFRHLAEDWSNPRFWMYYKRRMLQETVQFYLYSKNIPV